MDLLDSFQGIALLILFMLMALGGLWLLDTAGPRRDSSDRTQEVSDDPGAWKDIERTIEHYRVAEPEEGGGRSAQANFEKDARTKLDPLLDRIVERALAEGHHGFVRREEDEAGVRYRLEIRRSDHAAGQPAPYMTFAAGKDRDIAVVWGGDFPGPVDENGHHTEIDWFEINWRDLDKEVLKFMKRVFKTNPGVRSGLRT
ncbi:hypothetical protein [Phenylobacterium immobile]|uniref:hypothetical protein n=1 Tax=Phenylobacterium immobile TaxID=21 RepID=UPI000B04E9D9|nr:hypothetical protein [Phenylobacterium immobile]